MMGRYSFVIPESVARGQLRPLRDPSAIPLNCIFCSVTPHGPRTSALSVFSVPLLPQYANLTRQAHAIEPWKHNYWKNVSSCCSFFNKVIFGSLGWNPNSGLGLSCILRSKGDGKRACGRCMEVPCLVSLCRLSCLVIALLAFAVAPAGASPLGRHKPGEIIVKLKNGASLKALSRLNAKHLRKTCRPPPRTAEA